MYFLIKGTSNALYILKSRIEVTKSETKTFYDGISFSLKFTDIFKLNNFIYYIYAFLSALIWFRGEVSRFRAYYSASLKGAYFSSSCRNKSQNRIKGQLILGPMIPGHLYFISPVLSEAFFTRYRDSEPEGFFPLKLVLGAFLFDEE